MLYIKKKDLAKLTGAWGFATKLELAARMLDRVVPLLQAAGTCVWLVVDGAYFYRSFLRKVLPLRVTVVSRLRKDAALRTLPKAREQKVRGTRRKYGTGVISLAKRAAHRQGWQQLEVMLYGNQPVTKTYKTFLATYHLVGGMLRVVIVKETDGWEVFAREWSDLAPDRDFVDASPEGPLSPTGRSGGQRCCGTSTGVAEHRQGMTQKWFEWARACQVKHDSSCGDADSSSHFDELQTKRGGLCGVHFRAG